MKPENFYARPIIPLLLSLIFGILFGARITGFQTVLYVLVSICLIVIYSFFKRNTYITTIASLILFAAIGHLSIQFRLSPDLADNHIKYFANNKAVVTGYVYSPVQINNDRAGFVLRTEEVILKDAIMPVTGNLRVTVMDNFTDFEKGDKVRLTGRIKKLYNFNNPGGFDYKRYMAFQNIYASIFTQGKYFKVLEKGSNNFLYTSLENTRKSIRAITDNTDTKDTKAILNALIIGDRNGISQDLRNIFNRSGMGHVLAISGFHVGIVAASAFFIFRWVLSFSKFLLWQAWTKKGAAMLSLFPVIIYGLVSGMAPSTQRAVIMVSVFLLAFLVEREQDPLNTIAVAAMVILVIHPPAIFSISFQLSFMAVLAIIYGFSRFSLFEYVEGFWPKMKNRVLSLTLVSLFAIFGTFPIVMVYFNQVSLIGFFCNLIIVPVIGIAVIPLGLVALFVSPISIEVSALLINMAAFVLDYLIIIIKFAAELPFAAVRTITPSLLEIVCYYLLCWSILGLWKSNQKHIKKWAGIILAIVLIILSADISYWVDNRFRHRDLRITAIDVGQGTATLLELPGGYNMLVDGGGFSDSSIFDVGRSVIAPYLWQKKIKTIDTVVLSHANSDHLNGLLYIMDNFNVKTAWTNGESVKTYGYKQFVEIIKDREIDMPAFETMPRAYNINGVKLEIVYPTTDFMEKRDTHKWRDTNNNSLSLKVTLGEQSFLFPGDIEKPAEKELAEISGESLKSSVLFAPHHGSKSSSSYYLLDAVQPETVIISSGMNNRYHFPHESVLKRYANLGCDIYNTADQGAIFLRTDGETLNVDGYIKTNQDFAKKYLANVYVFMQYIKCY
ncbi:MAG: DNA internalization-related competence protein ComEC/Rec2 [Desulfobacterales bacterium]|nr:DNA internalization-related competence protein ComEC/Rec2 [Desulfobacterales bacterium]